MTTLTTDDFILEDEEGERDTLTSWLHENTGHGVMPLTLDELAAILALGIGEDVLLASGGGWFSLRRVEVAA